MAVSKADEASIRTLLGCLFNASIEIKVRQILKEMPHLAAADIRQIATVHALEKRMEAAELATEAKTAHRIAEIIQEAEAFNLRDAFEKLRNRASSGDKRAGELLTKLQETMRLWGAND
jgi:hypothetical protein